MGRACTLLAFFACAATVFAQDAPVIIYFRAAPTVTSLPSATLYWKVLNATTVDLTGFGPVGLSGTVTVPVFKPRRGYLWVTAALFVVS